MNILLINHYAGSPFYGMEFRSYYLGKEWIKLGHKVTIIGSSYSHLRYKQPLVPKDYIKENIDGIEYIWYKGISYKSSIRRIFNILSFVFKLNKDAKKIVKDINPDVIINSSTYPLDIYPAKKISKIAHAKLIYEIHDLWPLSPMLIGGYSKNHPFIKVMQIAEDYCYKNVDKVVSLLWNVQEHIKERGFYNVKSVCIPNGYLKEEWENSDNNLPKLHSEFFQNHKGKFIVGFAGGFAASGALDVLLEAANILKNYKNIIFVLIGKGPEENKLKRYINDNHLGNVSILPSVNKIQISSLGENFTVGYLGGHHSILHRYGTSPNKLTDYMLSSLPVIFSVDEPNSLVERVGCGIQVEADNSQLIANAIISLSKKSFVELKEIGDRGKIYAINNLEYNILAQKFIKEIENI